MSRPPGLPLKPPVADTWRPSSPRNTSARYTEPYRRNDDMYHFRGNDYAGRDDSRPPSHSSNSLRKYDGPPGKSSVDSYRPATNGNGFNFNIPPPPSLDLSRMSDTYRPPSNSHNLRSDHRDNNSHAYLDNSRQRHQGSGGYRGRGGRVKTADRPMLHTQRAPTPELMAGMVEEEGKTIKYRALEDLSDSDEADMDVSSDDESDNAQVVVDDSEQPKKKLARTEAKQSLDGDSAPRWSNPDPYFVLPPVDESQRKSKDVVKLIRKARVTITSEETPKAEAEADDFISFDFDDMNEGESRDHETSGGVTGAPTGPRAYSHRDNVQQRSSRTEAESNPIKQDAVDRSSDPALGSRKRNIDDEIKGPPLPIKKSGGKKMPAASGAILKEWRCPPDANPTPWCEVDHSRTVNMGDWLHKEIVDFYYHFRPTDFEDSMRSDLIERLRSSIVRQWPDAEIHPFGSYVAGLYLPTADMDLVFASSRYMNGEQPSYHYMSRSMLQRVASHIEKEIAAPGSVERIFGAKVPLVKYVDNRTGLRVDISFENDTGIVANRTFREWKAQYPAMPIIVTLIKQFLAMRGLNEPVNGGIGGFAVTCLVVSLFQLMPQVQSGAMIPEHHLGEILMEFFDLYGNEFNIKTTTIQLDPPAYVSKSLSSQQLYNNKKDTDKFSIIDPNRSSNDITGGSRNTVTIQKAFSDAYRNLQKRMGELSTLSIPERKNKSILEVIIGGDYSTFAIQRDHMLKCYQALRSRA